MSHQPAHEHTHLAAASVIVPADFALSCLADPAFVGRWALGSMALEPTPRPGVFCGRSMFDGSEAHVEIVAHPALGLIDYHVGTFEQRSPRIMARVVPGPVVGLDAGQCQIALVAWRSVGATDATWARTCTTHETEILLIKAQLEASFTAGSMP